MLENVASFLRMTASGVATIGSILIHHDEETGKDSVNLVPAAIWTFGLATAGCSTTTGETFSQCVKSVFTIFGG